VEIVDELKLEAEAYNNIASGFEMLAKLGRVDAFELLLNRGISPFDEFLSCKSKATNYRELQRLTNQLLGELNERSNAV
jgi:hypothetical protein